MFVDLKLGILWAFIVGLSFDESLSIFWFFCSIVFALLPDIDFWIELAERGTVGGKTLGVHRTLFHNPITYLPPTILIGVFFSPAWMILFALGVFGHFVHDSMGMGYGVRWLWPYSLRWYKLFSDREGNIRYNWNHRIVSWSPEEMTALLRARGNNNWFKEELIYAKGHAWKIALKLVTFVLGLVFLTWLLQYFF